MRVISIKPINFKSFFKEDLTNIKLKPLNLVFGPNSSGKSSYLQSLSFLKLNTEHLNVKDFVFKEKDKNVLYNYWDNPYTIKFNSENLNLVDFQRTFHQNNQQSLLDANLINETLAEINSVLDEIRNYLRDFSTFTKSLGIGPNLQSKDYIEGYDLDVFERLISTLILLRNKANNMKSKLSERDSFMSSKMDIQDLDPILYKIGINTNIDAEEYQEEFPEKIKSEHFNELMEFSNTLLESLHNLTEYLGKLSEEDQEISFEYLISTEESENNYLLNDGAEYSGLKFMTDEIKFKLNIAPKDKNINNPQVKSHSIYIEKFKKLKNLKVKNLPKKLSFENIDTPGKEKNIYFDFPELYALSLIYSFDEIIEDSFKGYDSEIRDYLNRTYFDDRFSNQNNKFENFLENHYFQAYDGSTSQVLQNTDSEHEVDRFLENNHKLSDFLEIITRFDDDLFQSRKRGIDNFGDVYTDINGNRISEGNYSFDNEGGTWVSESHIWQKYGFKFKQFQPELIFNEDQYFDEDDWQRNKIYYILSKFPWRIYTIQRAAANSLKSGKLKEIDYKEVLKLVKNGLKKIKKGTKRDFGKIILGNDFFPILEKTPFGMIDEIFSEEVDYDKEFEYVIFGKNIFKPVFNYILNPDSKIKSEELDSLFDLLRNSRAFNPDLGNIFNKIIETCVKSSKSLSHIGPIRHTPERLIPPASEEIKDIGFEGENAIHFLKKENVKNEVNKVFKGILNLNYDIDISETETPFGIYNYYQLRRPGTTKELSLSDVGFGVSQILPLIVQCVEYMQNQEEAILAIEEPELHLHPLLQSKIADMLLYFVEKTEGRLKFVVETHSENVIYRILKYIKDDKEMKKKISLDWQDIVSFYFFEINPDNLYTEINMLSFDNNGGFENDLPSGFIDNQYNAISRNVNIDWDRVLDDINNSDDRVYDEEISQENGEGIGYEDDEDSEEEEIGKEVVYTSQEYPDLKLIKKIYDSYENLSCSYCKKEFSTFKGGKWHIDSGWCLGMDYDV